jgi:transcription antitermination factor NusG
MTQNNSQKQGENHMLATMQEARNDRPTRWFIVASHPRKEFDAMHWIIGRGMDAYVPIVRAIQRRARGKTAAVLEPMFRNYLFVGDPMDGKRDLIPNLPCVMRVLEATGSNGRWATLRDSVVQAIFQQEMHERFAMPPEPKKRITFKPGAMLRIVDGKFVGFAARFDRLASRDRIVVLHNLLGCEVKTTLDQAQVVAA